MTLEFNSLKDRLFSGGAWALLGKIASIAFMVLINSLLARMLDADELGSFFLIFSMVTVIGMFGLFGLNQSVVPLIAKYVGKQDLAKVKVIAYKIVGFAIMSTIVMAVFFYAWLGEWLAIGLLSNQAIIPTIGVVSVWLVLMAVFLLEVELFRGFSDIKSASLYGGVFSNALILLTLLPFWWLSIEINLQYVVVLYAGSFFLVVGFASFSIFRRIRSLPSGGFVDRREIFDTSWPLYIGSLFFFLLTQVDVWMLGIFRIPDEVAQYGLVLRVIAIVSFPAMVVNSVISPLIAEMQAKEDHQTMEDLLRGVAFLVSVPSVLFIVAIFFYGDQILGFLFGDIYKIGGDALSILALGQLAQILTGSCGLVLAVTGHQVSLMRITAVSGLVTLILALFLVQGYGINGVASASAVGLFVQNLLMLLQVKKKLNLWTHVGSLTHLRAIVRGG